jgi:hypothetical protein
MVISEGEAPIFNNVIARSGDKTLSAVGYAGLPLTATLLHNTLVGSGTGRASTWRRVTPLYFDQHHVASHTRHLEYLPRQFHRMG